MKELKNQIKELYSIKEELNTIGNKINWGFASLARSIKGVEYEHSSKTTMILGFSIMLTIYYRRGWSKHKEAILKFRGGFSELEYHYSLDGKIGRLAFKNDPNTGEDILDEAKCWESSLSDENLGMKIMNDILEDIS